MKKTLITLFVFLCISVNAQTWPPAGMQGNGTENAPWQVTTDEHIQALANYVNASEANSQSTNGKYYKLMNNTYSGPVIGELYPFRGTFDGNNKSISGGIYGSGQNDRGYGIFGRIEGATIKNLNVNGFFNITATGSINVGCLVGEAKLSTISNCYADGSVFSIVGYNSFLSIGGLVGKSISSNITNCYASSIAEGVNNTVTGSYFGSHIFVGGLIGKMEIHNNNNSNVSNCYATGAVSGTFGIWLQSNATNGISAGGLVGHAFGVVTNCYATGNVSALMWNSNYQSNCTRNVYAGGLIGMIEGTINYCYATGNVSGEVNGALGIEEHYYGGLVGRIGSSTNFTIKNSIAANNSITANQPKYINRICGNGNSSSYLQNNYALNTMIVKNGTTIITPTGINAGTATPITTLQSLSFYTTSTNWNGGAWSITDPSGIWKICNGEGLPFLRWNKPWCGIFIPVYNVTDVPSEATIGLLPLTLTGTIVPSDATFQNIVWSVRDAGTTGATIAGNTFNATEIGTAIITATIAYGAAGTLNTPYTQDFYITVNKSFLTGTVTITGNNVFGETLTANTALSSYPIIPSLGILGYQWERNYENIGTIVLNNPNYTLVEEDIGHWISVLVTSDNCAGGVASYLIGPIGKAAQIAPDVPTMQSRTPNSITLNTVSGCEYNINGGAYQTSLSFTGLTPNTAYTFTQRKAETATHLASPPSPTATFSTEAEQPPILGGTVTITGNTIFGQTLTANTSGLICTPSGPLGALTYQWKRGTTNIGGNSSTYTLVQADIGSTITVTVTAANCTGNVTSSPTATVTKATQTAPAAPTLSSSTTSSITLNTITGCEYRRDNGNWQTSTVFSGLTPNTTYSFKARKSETVTHLASPESPGATFKTDEEVGINENQFENITVYPNPTTGILRIESRELRVEKIEIFDVFGRKLLSLLSPTSPETTVDISHLSAGVYFVKVSTEIGEAIKKVLKE